MKFLILLSLLVLFGCKITTGDQVSSSSFSTNGTCHLYQALLQDAICVEYSYNLNNSEVSADCDAQNTHYSAHSLTSHASSYVPLVISCDSSGKVGLCSLTNKRIRYYSREWTSVQAETDCVSINGKFSN